MKPYKVNKNSWHYKIVGHEHKDFCSYWRAWVAKVLMGCFAVMFALSVFAMFYVDYIVALQTIGLFIGFFLIIAALTIPVAFVADTVLSKPAHTAKIYKPKQPGLLKTKYLAWKSKICPMMEYEE